MEYKSVLKAIEEQKKDEQISAKLFRYTGLLKAIEFFSQKLNIDQIMDSAFDFVNELLTLEKSALFMINNRHYSLKKVKGISFNTTHIQAGENLERIATLYGTIIYDRRTLEKYFDEALLASFDVSAVMPLIMDNSLYGFIFISSKAIGEFNSDDYIICEALMRLINNALENYKKFEELNTKNKELDEKIFNLFAINQSSRALLSELELDALYRLSVDVFSELTQSSSTGFILYDEQAERFCLKAYRSISNKQPDSIVNFTLNKEAQIDKNKIIINTSDESDIKYFNSLFEETIDLLLNYLDSKYIVLLLKGGDIIGFVTLGPTVTGMEYKNSMFELIESMASSTYLALSNAWFFRKINEQKKLIESKLNKLISLNSLTQNINSSINVDNLLDVTLKTLEISFNVEKGIIALYDKEKNSFKMTNILNIDTSKKVIKPDSSWKRVFEGDAIFEVGEENIYKYLGKELSTQIGKASGILIVPIFIDRFDMEVLGVIIILKYSNAYVNDEENQLIIQTVAGHIAPILDNLKTIEEREKLLVPDYSELFKRDLKNEIDHAKEFSTDLNIVHINYKWRFSFKTRKTDEQLKNKFTGFYPVDTNNIFIISCLSKIEVENRLKQIEALNDQSIQVNIFTLGEEFKNYKEFIALF